MAQCVVWTKQHISVARTLEQTGRYVAKREFIERDLQEHAGLVLEVYDWLAAHSPNAFARPSDAEYPIWVSPSREAVMLPGPDSVMLELSVEAELITKINIDKWGTMLNYSYIPSDREDAERHFGLLEDYGLSDAKAYMSRFYPDIKREIVESWYRLFDDEVKLGGEGWYGNLWEIKQAWVRRKY